MPHDASHPIVRQPVQLDGEIWKPIPSTAGRYEASSLGRIRSLIAANHRGIFPRKVPLVCTPYSSSEYLLFNLRINGRYRCRQLGSLILEAHVGPAPTVHHEAAHVDGDASNNRIENLVWATPKENARHKQWHNTQPHRVTRSINGEDRISTLTRIHRRGAASRRGADDAATRTETNYADDAVASAIAGARSDRNGTPVQ
jgi:hypothetical protein